MNMYISNLGFHVQEEDLRQLFGSFGEVQATKVVKDRETGRSRGFGFVEMASEEEAKKAMSSLNNREIEGRAISVSVARLKESTGRRTW